MIMKYTKYPNAAKEFLRFMMEKEQFEPWLTGAQAYVATPLAGYASARSGPRTRRTRRTAIR
jgi:multiple sugar transport system substrate-binding protein